MTKRYLNLRTDPQTSEEFIYAFSSLRSRECNRMLKAWDTQLELSKYGEPALISNDYEGDDFGFSHQLVAKTDSCGDLSVIAQNEEYDNVWRYMINPSICDEPCGTTDNSTFACIFNGTCLEYEPLSASVKCDSCSNIGVIILVVVFCLVALLILGVASGAAVWYWKYKTGPRSEHYEQMQASE